MSAPGTYGLLLGHASTTVYADLVGPAYDTFDQALYRAEAIRHAQPGADVAIARRVDGEWLVAGSPVADVLRTSVERDCSLQSAALRLRRIRRDRGAS